MSGLHRLIAAAKQKATMEQLEHISATVKQTTAKEQFQQLNEAVKQKSSIEQLEHIITMVEQKARNERFQAAHCGCEAEGDDRAARAYQHYCGIECDE